MSKKQRTPIEAIRAYCKQCSCSQKDEIINCPVVGCELYPYRIELDKVSSIDIEAETQEPVKVKPIISIDEEIMIDEE